ncbi:DUF4175 family protein [Ekhidna sp.]|uniref:DUF4175 family protein n=1 Tax=Ekhidna sp. TaxID=2608089 RepID=UPI0032979EFD
MSGLVEIKSKLEYFKRRYYIRQIVLGILGFLIINSIVFLGVSSLEYQFWLGVTIRTILFFSFLILILISAYQLFLLPIMMLVKLNKGLSDEEAAFEISKHFPEIEDKLLNTLQLGRHQPNELLAAAIDKKSEEFSRMSFMQAVDFKPVKKYGFILFFVTIAFTLVSFINPSLIIDSPKRIANFKKEFKPKAPFQFILLNKDLKGFRGEDFVLQMRIEGEQMPQSAKILVAGENTSRSLNLSNNSFTYLFPKIQSPKEFLIEAAGFQSKSFKIDVNDRPDLVSMLIRVSEPDYTGGKRRTIENSGDLMLLEGSSVIWEINTLATDSARFVLNGKENNISRINETEFVFEERMLKDGGYQIDLFNRYSQNKSELGYSINVIKDEYPEIVAQYFPDSITYQSITIAGSISDDYGFTGLNLNYRKNKQSKYTRISLDINKNTGSQSYYAHWTLDTLDLKVGESIELYMSVLDNDGVQGPKESKASTFLLRAPSEDEINSLISDKQDNVEDQLDSTEKKAEEIADRLEELEEKLKSEQKFDWQEKKMLNDVIEDREKLANDIEKLKKQHEELLKANKQFQKQSPQTEEKNQKMQELLEQLMDDKTRELYEKLKELMKENAPSDQISQQLNQLKKNEQNLERDLERAMELFKRLKMESALEQNLQKLDTLSQKQEDASQSSENSQEQEEINKEFNEFRDKMDEIQELNQELKRPEAMEDFELEERQISKELREIMEQMDKEREKSESEKNSDSEQQEQQEGEQQEGQDQKDSTQKPSQSTKQKQKSAAQKMKNLSKKLSKMQGGMQMEMMQANLDQLRDILDNLVKLSFNQEDIMLEMREVNQSDPRFLELSQNQLKLKDDAKVIQDSLLSLASKVVQISSFVTREVGSINENIDEAIDYLKDRNRGRALSSQQFAMTSINNLALLLDDTMQQMQMSMSEAMGNSSSGDKKQQQGMPDLQELQNQLGERINELKGSGKSGRELSEELARLAAEQEMIRRQLEMLKEAQDGKPGGGLGGSEMKRAIDMMEQNEVDLVNKRLTQQLINRQKQIVTRMLEAEKAQRDQEMDEEREANKPSVISREIPPGFEKYLELKKKEIELLKTIPIGLNPFYKKEVNDYFRRLSSDEEND